ncbi:MAG: UDP-N-acetylmuramate dehydrogenase [Candidatus Atribacteria bacterium]|nr:UDP-N-acetylmuramate dehydrogenase [Candidatus Atribacteria bacterium]
MNINIDIIKNECKKQGIDRLIKYDEPLKNHSSLGIGGPADVFCSPGNIEDLKKVISIFKEYNKPFLVIGNGTNLLILDNGIRGLIINLNKDFKKIEFSDKIVKVGAGVSLVHLSKMVLNRELSGLEFACAIPGTLGGAIINNASFKGNCMADVVQNVTFLTRENKIERTSKSNLNFHYRECNLKGKPVIILEATLLLKKGNKEEIESKIKQNIEIRKSRQPLDKFSAGSIFKNPPGYYAGELIEKVGAKGLSRGKAEISTRHANFIVNNGGASARDILYLIEEIEKRVKKNFGIKLEREIEILGEP